MEPERLSQQVVYTSRTFKLTREEFRVGEGKEVWVDIIRHRGAVAVVPVLGNGKVLLERQYRYSLMKWIYEVPAGTLEPGEPEEECARRELEEETGYSAAELTKIGEVAVSPGYSDEIIRIFVARAEKKGGQRLEGDELIRVVEVQKEEALKMIERGEIIDGKTIVSLLLANRLGLI